MYIAISVYCLSRNRDVRSLDTLHKIETFVHLLTEYSRLLYSMTKTSCFFLRENLFHLLGLLVLPSREAMPPLLRLHHFETSRLHYWKFCIQL